MEINRILLRPILTEKATNLVKGNVYTFLVSSESNKHSIKQAIETLYKVTVSDVRISLRKGKEKKVGKRMKKKQLSKRKIAYVTVTTGKIDIFPQA